MRPIVDAGACPRALRPLGVSARAARLVGVLHHLVLGGTGGVSRALGRQLRHVTAARR
ncbi:hypothetical protein [Micromonospora coerulea]|uniref:hypothetical protein n=1 Tax=Micromonospora coerulea TaxID=47856 RepID=UPI0031F7FE02